MKVDFKALECFVILKSQKRHNKNQICFIFCQFIKIKWHFKVTLIMSIIRLMTQTNIWQETCEPFPTILCFFARNNLCHQFYFAPIVLITSRFGHVVVSDVSHYFIDTNKEHDKYLQVKDLVELFQTIFPKEDMVGRCRELSLVTAVWCLSAVFFLE